MNSFRIKYHNIDTSILSKSLKNNKISNNFQKFFSDLPALNIVNNDNLFKKTKSLTNKFARNKKIFFVFGTGGSNLGARALTNILQGQEEKKILYYDNIDPINFKNSVEKFKLEEIGYIIISKSGTTSETLSQFGCLIEIFKNKKKISNFFKNCLIITENVPNPLRKIAIDNNCIILDHDPLIGGRYSVFSNVGIVPATISGMDVDSIYNGVQDFLINVNNKKFNDHLKIAKFLSTKRNIKKLSSNVLITYSDSLYYFGKWFLQLWAESIGKKGRGLTPVHAIGTTDQHSQLQLYLQGPKDKFFTFITSEHSNKGLKINKNILLKGGLSYLAGKSMGDLMQAEQKSVIETFKKNKFSFREIYIPKIDEYSIGQLMTFFILETIASCNFLGVNPFNQPAVEQAKILTKKYLN